MNFVAAPTQARAVSAVLDNGITPWTYLPIDFDPRDVLRGTKDFHLILAGMDLEEHPTLNHAVLHARACGGVVTIEYL